jgi:hypothetical protein
MPGWIVTATPISDHLQSKGLQAECKKFITVKAAKEYARKKFANGGFSIEAQTCDGSTPTETIGQGQSYQWAHT